MFQLTNKVGCAPVNGFEQFDCPTPQAFDYLEDQSIDNWCPVVLWWNNTRIGEATHGRITWQKRDFDPTCEANQCYLRDWIAMTGIHITHPTTETNAVSVLIDVGNPARSELWRLKDYRVSSASGAVVWLIPK